ncbi:MAG: domain containing protein [Myxococcales bacterium]|nr:domain containing protein [Myxococcales bacterium]
MLAQDSVGTDSGVHVLMTPRPITIQPSSSVRDAAMLMQSCRVRHLPVVAPALVGILSLRDVVAADERALVGEVMITAVHSAAPTTTVASACRQMVAGRYSCLPVVEDGRLTGIFTATDALRFVLVSLEADSATQRGCPSVAQLMTPPPLSTVTSDTTLAAAWQTMQARRLRHLPVMRADELIGMLSDRDVLAAGRDWLRDSDAERQDGLLVVDAMSQRVSTTASERPASEAAATLLHRRFGALPVLSGRELRGIITVTDFMGWLLARA